MCFCDPNLKIISSYVFLNFSTSSHNFPFFVLVCRFLMELMERFLTVTAGLRLAVYFVSYDNNSSPIDKSILRLIWKLYSTYNIAYSYICYVALKYVITMNNRDTDYKVSWDLKLSALTELKVQGVPTKTTSCFLWTQTPNWNWHGIGGSSHKRHVSELDCRSWLFFTGSLHTSNGLGSPNLITCYIIISEADEEADEECKLRSAGEMT